MERFTKTKPLAEYELRCYPTLEQTLRSAREETSMYFPNLAQS